MIRVRAIGLAEDVVTRKGGLSFREFSTRIITLEGVYGQNLQIVFDGIVAASIEHVVDEK